MKDYFPWNLNNRYRKLYNWEWDDLNYGIVYQEAYPTAGWVKPVTVSGVEIVPLYDSLEFELRFLRKDFLKAWSIMEDFILLWDGEDRLSKYVKELRLNNCVWPLSSWEKIGLYPLSKEEVKIALGGRITTQVWIGPQYDVLISHLEQALGDTNVLRLTPNYDATSDLPLFESLVTYPGVLLWYETNSNKLQLDQLKAELEKNFLFSRTEEGWAWSVEVGNRYVKAWDSLVLKKKV